jgi:hypothetical protein
VETTETTPKQPAKRKKVITWAIVAAFVLGLGGLATWQTFYRTAVAETSYNSVYDVWNGDPRSDCKGFTDEGGGIAHQCAPKANIAPTDTVRFYAGECDGSTTGIPDTVMLDLPVGMLDKVDPQLGGMGWGDRGSIQVTYRQPVLGLFGDNEVLKVELKSPDVHCGAPVSGY